MEASDNTVVFNKELDALFVGDALVNGGIYYVGEGRSAGSIEGMLKLGAAYPAGTTALPGHSDPGNLQLIVEENVAQVRAIRRAAEAMAARTDTRTEKGTFRDTVRARLLGAYGELLRGKLSYGLTVDMIARMNLAGLERELLGGEAR
jgi:glyoxylase-like metal-dependent hydrolase (beta-lactamase superfamily II)